jgi:hypothetical protein
MGHKFHRGYLQGQAYLQAVKSLVRVSHVVSFGVTIIRNTKLSVSRARQRDNPGLFYCNIDPDQRT